MLKEDVKRHYGSMAAAARAMGISKSAVHQWPELVPELWAYKFEVTTGGALKVDPSSYAHEEDAHRTKEAMA